MIQREATALGSKERHHVLDALRGLAILGILYMNIIGFGTHYGAYDNPYIAGGATGRNLWVWVSTYILIEGKFRALFAMMFGASIVLLTSRMEAKGNDPSDYFYKRYFWLIAFGFLHAYLFWTGDILYYYGFSALLLFLFRHTTAKRLLIIGITVVVVNGGFALTKAFYTRKTFRLAEQARVLEEKGVKLTPKQKKAKWTVDKMKEYYLPDQKAVNELASMYQGSFYPLLEWRSETVWERHSFAYHTLLDGWGCMFLGMALLKFGFLTCQRTRRFYWKTLLLGYGLGLPLCVAMAYINFHAHFDIPTNNFIKIAYDTQRLLVAIAHTALFMLLFRSGWLRWLMNALTAVGRTALSNYILQSIICSILFFGYGFSLYGRFDRLQLMGIAFAINVIQLLLSPLWLAYFQFGPIEWLWRSATQWRMTPLLRQAPAKPLTLPTA